MPVATYSIVGTNLVDDATLLELPIIFKPGVNLSAHCVGIFDGTRWTPPQGTTNIGDAVAAIKTWQNNGSTTHLSRVDVENEQVNHVVNINDVFMIIKGLKGEPYPFSDPQDCLP